MELFKNGKNHFTGKAKLHKIDSVICSHSKEIKVLSYSQINTVSLDETIFEIVSSAWFSTRSGYLFSFLLPLTQEGQLSVTGKSVCMKYWLTLKKSKPAQEKIGYRNVLKYWDT